MRISEEKPFNPTVVRLRPILATLQINASETLSIPLWCDCDQVGRHLALNCDPAFNPTVVRLRPFTKLTDMCTTLHFQSHCGAIATPTSFVAVGKNVFFQSHCGAIATCHHLLRQYQFSNFQSHCGAIATNATLMSFDFNTVLSIPLWCDCDLLKKRLRLDGLLLSIPLWCDCDEVFVIDY